MAKRKPVRIGMLHACIGRYADRAMYASNFVIYKHQVKALGAKPGDILYAYVVKPAKKGKPRAQA